MLPGLEKRKARGTGRAHSAGWGASLGSLAAEPGVDLGGGGGGSSPEPRSVKFVECATG